MGRFIVVITLVMSMVVVQNAFAETFDGAIQEITTRPNTITVDGTVIYGVKINYLLNQYDIDLYEGLGVSVEADEFECSDGTIKNMATAMTVGDVTVQLR